MLLQIKGLIEMTKVEQLFTKLAAGPPIYTMTPTESAANPDILGKYFTRDFVKNHPEYNHISDPRGIGQNDGIMMLKPKGDYPTKDIERAIFRHELTHYLRDKRGKLTNIGKPSLTGVLSTLREEFIAGIKALPKKFEGGIVVPDSLKGTNGFTSAIESTKHLYPRGILRAILTRKV